MWLHVHPCCYPLSRLPDLTFQTQGMMSKHFQLEVQIMFM